MASNPLLEVTLVHGAVIGTGRLDGIEYSHCWIEVAADDGVLVLDVSNGMMILTDKEVYYDVRQVSDNVHKYSPDNIRERGVSTGHWGPWDLVTSTGL